MKITICDFKICFFYLETPCGGLPLLTIDGTVIAQSVAVARFLARECKLDGHSNVQKAQADMIVDCVTDCFLAFVPEKEGKPNNFKDETLPKTVKLLESLLKANGGDHFVGCEVNLNYNNVSSRAPGARSAQKWVPLTKKKWKCVDRFWLEIPRWNHIGK